MTLDDGLQADYVRGRIGGALAELPAPPAPVAVVIRKGKVMRARRRVVVVAAVALAAVAAAIVPGIVHQLSRPQPAVKPPRITVTALGKRAVNNVIAAGTINGKRWQVQLTKKRGNDVGCWSQLGSDWAPSSNCIETVGWELKHWHTYGGPAAIWTYSPAIFGPVEPDVARVTMRLTDGVVLNIRPVEAFGRRWIGIVLPGALAPAKVVAYSRHAEIAHSVPYVGPYIGESRDIEFLSWLPPGDDGPVRMTKTISGGGTTWVLHTGPWGNVLVGPGMVAPLSLGEHPNGALAGGGGLPRTVPMAFSWPAAYMKLVMSDGSTRTVRLVRGAGLAFAIIRAPSNPRIVRWDVYGPGGRRLTGGTGAPGR